VRGGAPRLLAAVLPASRSVQIGTPASAFATIINQGPGTATGCEIFPVPDLPGSFGYQTTDPATNLVTGSPNTPADIGAGAGYYTVRLAQRLGPGATIYAEDVKAGYLDELKARLRREGVTGVTLVLGEPRNPGLPPRTVDVVLLSHVYHEIENPFEFLYRLHPALAPGARVAVIDNDRPTGSHGTPPTLLRCELAAVGYRQVDFLLLTPADGYLAVFTPPPALPPVASILPCRQ